MHSLSWIQVPPPGMEMGLAGDLVFKTEGKWAWDDACNDQWTKQWKTLGSWLCYRSSFQLSTIQAWPYGILWLLILTERLRMKDMIVWGGLIIRYDVAFHEVIFRFFFCQIFPATMVRHHQPLRFLSGRSWWGDVHSCSSSDVAFLNIFICFTVHIAATKGSRTRFDDFHGISYAAGRGCVSRRNHAGRYALRLLFLFSLLLLNYNSPWRFVYRREVNSITLWASLVNVCISPRQVDMKTVTFFFL